MELIDRLKARLEIKDDKSDSLLEEIVLSSKENYAELRHPVTPLTVDEHGDPIVPKRWHGWVVSAAVEHYNRIGIEGQVGHSENGISRSYDSADLSKGLKSQITPEVSVVHS